MQNHVYKIKDNKYCIRTIYNFHSLDVRGIHSEEAFCSDVPQTSFLEAR